MVCILCEDNILENMKYVVMELIYLIIHFRNIWLDSYILHSKKITFIIASNETIVATTQCTLVYCEDINQYRNRVSVTIGKRERERERRER